MSDSKALSFWCMFVRPLDTLASLGEKADWLRPVLVSSAFCAAANYYVIHCIGLDRLVNAAAKSTAILDPQAAVQNALARPYQIHAVQAISTFIGSLLTTLVVAKVVWLVVTLLGREVRFSKVLALNAYVTAQTSIIRGCMLALTTTLIRDLNTLDLRNPLATNPAFFLQPASPVSFRVLSSLDVLTFLNIALLAIGLTKICPRLSLRAAALAIVVPWGIYTGTTLLLPPLLS